MNSVPRQSLGLQCLLSGPGFQSRVPSSGQTCWRGHTARTVAQDGARDQGSLLCSSLLSHQPHGDTCSSLGAAGKCLLSSMNSHGWPVAPMLAGGDRPW